MGIRGSRRAIARRHLSRRIKRRPGKLVGRGGKAAAGGSAGGASGPNPLANDPNFE